MVENHTHDHDHEEEEDRIVIPDENGEEHLFDILFSFDVEETNKSYIVVSPVEATEEDEDEESQEVFAFRFEGDLDGEFNLYPIESDEEWDMVEEMLNTFAEEEDL
jgi:uncharacterized protein YrzB (UPF0473 family)